MYKYKMDNGEAVYWLNKKSDILLFKKEINFNSKVKKKCSSLCHIVARISGKSFFFFFFGWQIETNQNKQMPFFAINMCTFTYTWLNGIL